METNMRNYHIVIGSKRYFDEYLPDFKEEDIVYDFSDSIKLSDAFRESGRINDHFVSILVVRNNNYNGIVENAHDRLDPLIEELTTNSAEIYIHYPPRILMKYLEEQHERLPIKLSISSEKYEINRDPNIFINNIKEISSHILGQQSALTEISKSLWYLTTVKREKPYVIMLYGNSGLGKTELVREIAKKFFDGKFLEKHLSMFKNDNYTNYFFGDKPNRRSIGFDLLERESNLIFFDELDKCPEYFFSTFYTLFDNVQFKDSTYDVNVSGTVIILTSNYNSKEEMQEKLGLPIFYRIDKFIHFNEFNCNTIYRIVQNEISERKAEYNDKISPDAIYAAVSPLVSTSGENARTIKYKVQQVIEDLLFEEIHEKF